MTDDVTCRVVAIFVGSADMSQFQSFSFLFLEVFYGREKMKSSNAAERRSGGANGRLRLRFSRRIPMWLNRPKENGNDD